MRLILSKTVPLHRTFSTSRFNPTWGQTVPNLKNLPFDINEEVTHALANNQAVVALESTLFTHGKLSSPPTPLSHV